jgi:hypothetical protein
MQDRFVNRLDLQRNVIKLVNKYCSSTKELAGLSEEAVRSWLGTNPVYKKEGLVQVILSLSNCFNSLANKSQEAIDEEYSILEETTKEYLVLLEKELRTMS